jgi:hypothetical protein
MVRARRLFGCRRGTHRFRCHPPSGGGFRTRWDRIRGGIAPTTERSWVVEIRHGAGDTTRRSPTHSHFAGFAAFASPRGCGHFDADRGGLRPAAGAHRPSSPPEGFLGRRGRAHRTGETSSDGDERDSLRGRLRSGFRAAVCAWGAIEVATSIGGRQKTLSAAMRGGPTRSPDGHTPWGRRRRTMVRPV